MLSPLIYTHTYLYFCHIFHIETVTAEVKPEKEHAGATLEVPSEEILKKSAQK